MPALETPGRLSPAAWAPPVSVAPSGGPPQVWGVPWMDGLTFICRLSIANPGDPPNWIDLSARVRSLSTRRGRVSEQDRFQAGTASIVFDNRDRYLDPSYMGSPWYGFILPMRRINIQWTYAGTTYDQFTGYVDGWPQAYTNPSDATVTVTATDAFKFLANARADDSVYAVEILSDNPLAWYRLGETAGTVAFDSSGHGYHAAYQGGATSSSRAGLIQASTNTAIALDGTDDAITRAVSPLSGFPFTLEAWGTIPASGSAYYLVSLNGVSAASISNMIVQFGYDPSLATFWARVLNQPGAGAFVTTSGAAGYSKGLVYHVVATFTNGTTAPNLYVNGVLDNTATNVSNTAVIYQGDISIGYFGAGSTPGYSAASSIDEVAIYSSALSASRVAAHYAAGNLPWSGDDAGTRIGRILDRISWSPNDRSIATGKAILGNQPLNNDFALPLLQAIEVSEQGYLFIDPAGKVVFQNRHQRLTATASVTSQATFGDTGSSLPYMDITMPYEDHTIVNRVKGQRAGGSVIEVSDVASRAQYLERAVFFDNLGQSTDLEVTDLVNWRLAHYKDALLRIDELTVNPRTSPATLYPQILGRTFGDRVTVRRTPQGIGSSISKDVHIEGVEHSITPDNWVTKFYLSPADTQTYLILDDATFGQLDNNRLAF